MRVIPFPGANDNLVPTLPSADWRGASGGTLIQKAPAVVDGSDLIFDFQVAEGGKFDLAGLIGRSEIRNSIQLHWLSYPNLKTACEAMAKVAGHQWCRQTGVPLLLEAIEGATREAVRAAKEGEAHRVIFASYMNALATIVSQLAVHRTIGEGAHGIVEWDPIHPGIRRLGVQLPGVEGVRIRGTLDGARRSIGGKGQAAGTGLLPKGPWDHAAIDEVS
jgi:hypothetical protein